MTLTEHLLAAKCDPDKAIRFCSRGFANEVSLMPIPLAFAADAQALVDNADPEKPHSVEFVAVSGLGRYGRLAVLGWLNTTHCGTHQQGDDTDSGVPDVLWDEWASLTWDGR